MPRISIRLALAIVFGLSVVHSLGARQAASSDVPDGVVIERSVAYLPEGRDEKADLYLPAKRDATVRSPAVVIIHGGGWSGGKRDAARN